MLVPALSLSVLSLPPSAAAEDTPAAQAAPAASGDQAAPAVPADQAAPTAPADQAAPAAPKPRARLTWEEHFARANTARDGHLTLEEAKAGYPTIARHFHSIDVDGKGYVTEGDIRAWHALRRAASHLSQPPEDELRPRNAFQRIYPDPQQKPQNTNTTAQVSAQP